MALVIMACSETKHPGARAACLKYQGRQHTAIREAMVEWGWAVGSDLYILSAKYGLVPSYQPLPDYNHRMTPSRAAALAQDADQIATAEALTAEHDTVYVYGGQDYRAVVEALFPDSEVVALVGANRGCGDHFSALQEQLADCL